MVIFLLFWFWEWYLIIRERIVGFFGVGDYLERFDFELLNLLLYL